MDRRKGRSARRANKLLAEALGVGRRQAAEIRRLKTSYESGTNQERTARAIRELGIQVQSKEE